MLQSEIYIKSNVFKNQICQMSNEWIIKDIIAKTLLIIQFTIYADSYVYIYLYIRVPSLNDGTIKVQYLL